MKCPTNFLTGANSNKISAAIQRKEPFIDLTVREFMKAIPIAAIRNMGCLPTIRLKQESNLKIDTHGQMEGSGFSIATYYENHIGIKYPVDETYSPSFIQALIHINGTMPYPPTATEYDPDNKHYPYTVDTFSNISNYLSADKNRRIVLSPDSAKINGIPNMVVSFSTAENPYLSGTYDSNNFHVVCLGVTNPLEAIRIVEEIVPQVEKFREENPDCFMTDAKPFGYPLAQEPLSRKTLEITTEGAPVRIVENEDPYFMDPSVDAGQEFPPQTYVSESVLTKAAETEDTLAGSGLTLSEQILARISTQNDDQAQ